MQALGLQLLLSSVSEGPLKLQEEIPLALLGQSLKIMNSYPRRFVSKTQTNFLTRTWKEYEAHSLLKWPRLIRCKLLRPGNVMKFSNRPTSLPELRN